MFCEETGLQKETIQGYAHKTGTEEDDMKYEFDFEVPSEFGEIGAVLVENEHHKEMYLKTISLEGFPNGTITFDCESWVHSKNDNPEKRIFFTNKVSHPAPLYIESSNLARIVGIRTICAEFS